MGLLDGDERRAEGGGDAWASPLRDMGFEGGLVVSVEVLDSSESGREVGIDRVVGSFGVGGSRSIASIASADWSAAFTTLDMDDRWVESDSSEMVDGRDGSRFSDFSDIMDAADGRRAG